MDLVRAATILLALSVGVAPALPLPDPDAPPTPGPARAVPWSSSAVVLIAQVYPSAVRDDEFVVLENPGVAAVDLAGWSLSDGEGAVTFPPDTILPPGGRIVAAQNATSYAEDLLEPADFAWEAGPVRLDGGVLRLANAGDEVVLNDPLGRPVDVYVYGNSAYGGAGWTGPPARAPGRGEPAVRAEDGGRLIDRDAAADWDGLRSYRIGQSRFRSDDILGSAATHAVVSPDDGRGLVLSFLDSASESLEVASYTLTSEAIASVLAHAARRGVRVRVLLDGSPVGGLDETARGVAAELAGFGAEVRWLRGDDDVVKRYRYLHAKYAIVDATRVLVSSENLGDAGFPAPNEGGNRGWTVLVEDATLAGSLRTVFEEDFDPRRRDSVAVDPAPPRAARDDRPPPWSSKAPTAGRARLLIGPDTSLDLQGILGLLASARNRIGIEAFYLEETWRDAPNPFLEAAFHAARRGVAVRILLDGSWWNDDPDAEGNDDVVERLNARAAAEGLPLEARLVTPYGRVDRVHNKGVVVDGTTVLVSSMNWALGSATENREIGLILEDPALAARFEAALQADWERAAGSGFRIDDPAVVAVLYGSVAAASVLSLRKLRGTSKRLRFPVRMGLRARPGLLRRGAREVRLLPVELVAEPRPGARGGRGTRRRRGAARGHRRRRRGHRHA